LKIENLGKVTHGVTLSRVEAKPGEHHEVYKLYTMQDLSRETGQYNLEGETQEVEVSKEKFDKSTLSKENMIIIGLTSYKAMVIEKSHSNKIIPSNFVIIELDLNKVDPYYFTWCFNEHPEIQKQLQVAMQGSIIRALSIQMLREFFLPLPPLVVQQNIGKVYDLKRKRDKALFEKNILEEKLYNHMLVRKLKEDIKCQ
jgi:restriction endonuclease S subunit